MTAALTRWKAIGPGLIEPARQSGHLAATYFPGLVSSEAQDPGMPKSDSKRGKD